MKLVINRCFGGFGLSHKAIMKYAELKGIKLYAWVDEHTLRHTPEATVETATMVHYATVTKEVYAKFNKLWKETVRENRGDLGDGGYFCESSIDRDDGALVKTVELLGDEANGHCAKLKVITIPDGTEYQIDEYDGLESVHEVHKSWD